MTAVVTSGRTASSLAECVQWKISGVCCADTKPLHGGSHACVCQPVYARNCDSAVSSDTHRNHVKNQERYINKQVCLLP